MGCFRIFIFFSSCHRRIPVAPINISIELFTLRQFLQIPIPLAEGEHLY